MTTAHIQVEHLNLTYQEHPGLKDINVAFPRNEVTAIIGPSGCGKTSLLRCLNRMIDLVPGAVVTGKVLVGDMDIYAKGVDVTAVRKRVGLIAQKPTVLPMSIFENVAYGPRIYGYESRKKLHDTVARCLVMTGLWDEVKHRLKDPAGRLSIGQQQRLCLARGLAVEPEVLCFDEPTSALDPLSAQWIEREILNLKQGYTVVVVTHNLQQAMRIADNVIFMRLGEVVEAGSADEVLGSPKHEFTQAYINGIEE
ncbi:MAG: phosphate ABC transporter ATP-binding protein [Armatimonadota bacterium]